MPYTTQNNAYIWGREDPVPSTRESTSLLTKWYPIYQKLAVPGTAQDLIVLNSIPATVNMVTNPSFETGTPPTGFSASGATLARSAAFARSGSYSMEVTPNNIVAGEGFYWDLGVIPATPKEDNRIPISISCYFYDPTNSGNGVKVRLVATTTTPFTGNVNYLDGSIVSLTSSWQRSTLSASLSVSDIYHVYVITNTQFVTVFYCDDLQVEAHNSVTDYCDGDQNPYCSWDGAAHASISRREKYMGSIRDYTLHTDKDIYVAYDWDATTSCRLVEADSTWWPDHPVYITKKISFINAWPLQQPTVSGECWGF
jgi:hypothetical protein